MESIVDIAEQDKVIVSLAQLSKGLGLEPVEIVKLILSNPSYAKSSDIFSFSHQQAMLLISILPNNKKIKSFKRVLEEEFINFQQAINTIQHGRKACITKIKNKKIKQLCLRKLKEQMHALEQVASDSLIAQSAMVKR